MPGCSTAWIRLLRALLALRLVRLFQAQAALLLGLGQRSVHLCQRKTAPPLKCFWTRCGLGHVKQAACSTYPSKRYFLADFLGAVFAGCASIASAAARCSSAA